MFKLFIIMTSFLFLTEPLAAVWTTPITLSTISNEATFPDIAIDSSGNVTAIWSEFDYLKMNICISTLVSGDNWSSTSFLSLTGQNAYNPSIKMNSNGDAVVVWVYNDGFHSRIAMKTKSSGGDWSDIITLSNEGENAASPKAAIENSGNIVVVWQKTYGNDVTIQVAQGSLNGVWSAPVDLSIAGQYVFLPQIASNSDGIVIIMWTGFDGTYLSVQTETFSNNGIWSNPLLLSAINNDSTGPQIAINSSGVAIAIWREFENTNYRINSAVLTPNKEWGSFNYLSANGQDAYYPHVTIDPIGNIFVIWTRFDGINFIVESSTSYVANNDANGNRTWTEPVPISNTGQDSFEPQIVSNSLSQVFAVWSESDGINLSVKGATFGSTWSAPFNLSVSLGDMAYPKAVIDDQGKCTVIWCEKDTNFVVKASSSF